MSSTLCFGITPPESKSFVHFKLPIKGIFARRYYDHDGTLGGNVITLGRGDLDWLNGLKSGLHDNEEVKDVEKIIKEIERNGSVDMWFE